MRLTEEEKMTLFRALAVADKHGGAEDQQYNDLIIKLRGSYIFRAAAEIDEPREVF